MSKPNEEMMRIGYSKVQEGSQPTIRQIYIDITNKKFAVFLALISAFLQSETASKAIDLVLQILFK